MVTKSRLSLMKRAVKCFADQSYPRKELIVVPDDNQSYHEEIERHVEEAGVEHVRVVPTGSGFSLGALRNLSMDAAAGEIICQWDDDDRYLPDRLMCQVGELFRAGCRACFLSDNLQLLAPDGTLFWVNWADDGRARNEYHVFPPSVMLFKDTKFRYPESGHTAFVGEDLALAADLFRNVPVASLGGMGCLYLYEFHSRNTLPKEHHYAISRRRSVSNGLVRLWSTEIRRTMQYHRVPRPVHVHGSDGLVFTIG
jgi:glycosyltransferase involved in cell wall biosynthesis